MKTLKSIRLLRHGYSQANAKEINPEEVGDHNVALTQKGIEQAHEAGVYFGPERLQNALVYTSPYRRTRQTTKHFLEGAGKPSTKVLEDPRLREVEHGYESVEEQEAKRAVHGWFYYRFDGGESPADCYDRTSSALESILRQVERKQAENVIIVSHGLTIRCFITRFLHLSVEDFESMANPGNCQMINIRHHEELKDPVFKMGRWGVTGVNLRPQRS